MAGWICAQPNYSFAESVLPLIEAGQAEMVQPGRMMCDQITLFPKPGHTLGHVSIAGQSRR